MTVKDIWDNQDNVDFYQNIPINKLAEISEVCGLDSCCDVKAILPYLLEESSILEIGSGYGRVINYLQKKISKSIFCTREK